MKKIFQRALQYCDPKKVHLALLGMYERTKQNELADELFDRMTKRFKTSCKVSLSLWNIFMAFKLRARLVFLYMEQLYDLHDAIVDLVAPHSVFSHSRQGC